MAAKQNSTYDEAFARALAQCTSANNDLLSCFPTNTTVVAQDEIINFVWDSRLIQQGDLAIHLVRGTDDVVLDHSPWGIPNSEGGYPGISSHLMTSYRFNGEWAGENISTPFYFTISPWGMELQKQAVFHAIQMGPAGYIPLESTPPTEMPTNNSTSHVTLNSLAGVLAGGATVLVLAALGIWRRHRARRAAVPLHATNIKNATVVDPLLSQDAKLPFTAHIPGDEKSVMA